MPDRKIEITVDEQVARGSPPGRLCERISGRPGRKELVDWLGKWGLEFAVHVVKPKRVPVIYCPRLLR